MTSGSSTGSAVLVSTGAADMALGADQGGSIRGPASSCGIVGLKPTWGLVPYTGILSLEPTLDHVGPMTKTVYDCALLLEVIAGYDDGLDPRQPRDLTVPEYTKQLSRDLTGMKIGVLKEGFDTPFSEKDVDDNVMKALRNFPKTGASVVDISIPMHSVGSIIGLGIFMHGLKHPVLHGLSFGQKGYYPSSLIQNIHHSFKSNIDDASLTVKRSLMVCEYLSRQYGGRMYAKFQNMARKLGQKYDEVLNKCDVLVMPTLTKTIPKLPPKNASLNDATAACRSSGGNLLFPFNVTGHPAISIDTGYKTDGLPVGMMIVGKHFDESTLFKVAFAYEQSQDAN
uniref:Glutamyl-tRNA(Gln) amidotransferase subunit A, chloroplastic/mitochondrial-like n=1 Tax=Saccoglossus kowalevskii TaxID=10224 RepID=A0ABM0MFP7_SACKO|nr:PREDICTED: glutamyl-tRNA(Gln) amidotransferase subunit A, chloroplastic/mitochondrial-like [Saccoglossus kowalevskii]